VGGQPVLGATALNTSTEWISAVLAVLAAAVYVLGMSLQQRANLHVMKVAADAGTPNDAGARKVLRSGLWWVGMGTMVVGFVLHATALGLGSLAVVQPLQVTEIIFMVPASAWVAHTAIARRDWYSAGAVAVGLALFLVATQPGQGGEVATGPNRWLLVFALILVAAAALFEAGRRNRTYRAARFGAMTGVVFGLQGAVLKQATGQLGDIEVSDVSTWWAIPAVTVVNLAALVGQNVAMRAGRLSSALSIITVVTPAVSTVLGIALFGETLSTTPSNVVIAGVGVGITVGGVIRLAASPALLAVEAEETAEPTSTLGPGIDGATSNPIEPRLGSPHAGQPVVDEQR